MNINTQKWDEFLDDVLENNEDKKKLELFLGAALLKKKTHKFLFILDDSGPVPEETPRTGINFLIESILRLFDTNKCSATMLKSPFHAAALEKKDIYISTPPSYHNKDAYLTLKKIISGEDILINKKNYDLKLVKNHDLPMVILFNDEPIHLYENDESMKRRMETIVIKCRLTEKKFKHYCKDMRFLHEEKQAIKQKLKNVFSDKK